MKNLLFLFIVLFSFGLLSSCGDENFEPYESSNGGNNTALALLPSEITISTTDEVPVILISKFSYDENNRLVSIHTYTDNTLANSQLISYNTDGLPKEVESFEAAETQIITYEYISANEIREHIKNKDSDESSPITTNTLYLNSGSQLIKKFDVEFGKTINYEHNYGNLILAGTESYYYDNYKGMMNSTKTPHWLLISLEISGYPNFVNNITKSDDNGDVSVYEYSYNVSKYPIKADINDGKAKMEIKYIASKL